MARRHQVMSEVGGWTLILLSVAALLYWFFSKTKTPDVKSNLLPTITPDLASKIAAGTIPAKQIELTDVCPNGFTKYLGVGNASKAWCVMDNVSAQNKPPIDTTTISASTDLTGPRTQYEQTMIDTGNTLVAPPEATPRPTFLPAVNPTGTNTQCDDSGNCAVFDDSGNLVGYA